MTAVPAPLSILAVTGLQAEARIAAGSGVAALAGGGDPARLALLLQAQLEEGAQAIISFGIAGGLAPGLPAGSVVVAEAVDDGGAWWPVDVAWRSALLAALPHAVQGRLSGVDHAIAGADGKAQLHRRTGAVAVDMESHIAARLAHRYRVPFAALRVVADPAERTLPEAALVGMRPDGTTDVAAVIRALVRHPADLPGLIRTAFDAQAAFRALRLCREKAGDLLGLAIPSPQPDAAVEPVRPSTRPAPIGLHEAAGDVA